MYLDQPGYRFKRERIRAIEVDDDGQFKQYVVATEKQIEGKKNIIKEKPDKKLKNPKWNKKMNQWTEGSDLSV